MHDAVADLLRPPLVPELRPDVAARPPRDVHRRLVDVPALGATPHELPVLVVHDLDLAVEAAPLAVVRLRVQLGVHDVVIDETHEREDGGDVVLEVRHLHVGDRPARREVLELRLQRELRERIDLLGHVDVVGVRHVVPVRHPRDDAETPLQALCKAVGRGLERRSVERVVDVLGGLPLRRVLVQLPHDLEAELLPLRLGELPAREGVDAFPKPRIAERDRRVAAVQEGIDALRDVIYHIETYDVTTVRASTPMYLLARVIKSMGIKMVLSGEGADEIFGGYLYFHKAPSAEEFHCETVRKLSRLHLYDCLRANKSLSAWGVEGRVPFLDKEFLDVAMSINPADKMITAEHPIEKWVLRKAFEHLLPHEIVWRQKEQFSDGVGYNWIDSLKLLAEQQVTDGMMKQAKMRFPINPPLNKEEYLYRSIFEDLFPSQTAAQCVPSVPSVACSTAEALAWDESFRHLNDPSGRAVTSVHKS